MKKIAVFASGSGTNAQKIFEKFKDHPSAEVVALYSNKSNAYALERARDFGIDTKTFDREEFYNTEKVLQDLQRKEVDFIVLAGFLWLIPNYLVKAFDRKMVNIHPALLPKFGGKGMYGMKVHEAVINKKEKETGITIHYVNAAYDEGDIILQATCAVLEHDTPESVAKKIHELEYEHLPKVVEKLVLEL